MALGRQGLVQDALLIGWHEMPSAPGHVCYDRLNAVLDEAELLLLQRYYGSREDARYELARLDRTGRLQASFARLLRLELGMPGTPVVGRRIVGSNGRVYV